MTSRECIKAAIEHRSTDRVPYFIDLCAETWDILKPDTQAQTPEAFLDNDVLDIPVPWWHWHELSPDWTGDNSPISTAKVMGYGSYAETLDRIKAIKDAGCDKYLLVRIYGSHFEKAYFARGIENLLADFVADPDFAKRLLDRIIDINLVMLENVLALAEIDGILLGSDWGSQRDLLMSPEAWQNLIRPGEQKEYDLIHGYGKDVWIHSCGNIEKIIPSLVEMGVDVLNPLQPETMDVYALKERYGAALTFWGGISTQQTLPYGTPDEVRQEARQVRDAMSKDGGYILAPAQSIQKDVPAENILALLEVAREQRTAGWHTSTRLTVSGK